MSGSDDFNVIKMAPNGPEGSRGWKKLIKIGFRTIS